ncbi:DMT family transporter [Microbacterium sp. gxy059]|uniref:DMT family transporter n=1 Tax=Microbacterium sp. gxy059 TaxID=2957199 RepID=UPI003D9666CA
MTGGTRTQSRGSAGAGRTWALLVGAVVAEVTGTMALRAVLDHPAWVGLVAVAYIAAFAMLGLTLRAGMPVGVAYGVWAALGVALTAILGAWLFGEALSATAIVGIAAIVIGVVIVETGAPSGEARASAS